VAFFYTAGFVYKINQPTFCFLGDHLIKKGINTAIKQFYITTKGVIIFGALASETNQMFASSL